MMPTQTELVEEVRDVLDRAGVGYASTGSRDKHFAVWLFSIIIDEASRHSGAWLYGVRPGPEAVFRGNPSDLDDPPSFTCGLVHGALREWEVHVDVNILGTSGASHGVDVSMLPSRSISQARSRSAAPALTGNGLGIEAKCFANSLTPNEGRVALGFYEEVGGVFWLAANKDNAAVATMLSAPGRRTRFFGNLKPGSATEADFRAAVRAQLNR